MFGVPVQPRLLEYWVLWHLVGVFFCVPEVVVTSALRFFCTPEAAVAAVAVLLVVEGEASA
jgi:hypothetical protein